MPGTPPFAPLAPILQPTPVLMRRVTAVLNNPAVYGHVMDTGTPAVSITDTYLANAMRNSTADKTACAFFVLTSVRTSGRRIRARNLRCRSAEFQGNERF